MYPIKFINDVPLVIRAPLAAVGHYGLIKLAIKHGALTAAGVIDFQSYLLLHTVGAVFEKSIKLIGTLFCLIYRNTMEKKQTLLKRVFTLMTAVSNKITRTIDKVYCYAIKKTFGPIHTAEEAAKLPDRKLCWSEIFRKVFAEVLTKQFLCLGSWEIGRRSVKILLNNTLTFFIPMAKVYDFGYFFGSFCISYLQKINALRSVVYTEQTQEIKDYFDEPIALIDEQIKEIFKTLNQEVQQNKQIEKQKNLYQKIDINFQNRYKTVLTLEQQIKLLNSLSTEFKEIVDDFEVEWQYYNSSKIDALNKKAAFYESISKQFYACQNEEQREKFKEDLNTYINPKNKTLFGRLSIIK